ncbi:MAG: thermonuclease family protein [Limnohabitans sp.]|nr:thermonuclease family protein [Limnohabitans sp.]
MLFSTFSFSQTFLTGKVVGIKDGDTIVVIDSLKNQYTLRLAEIDCPEKNQPYGTKAKQFTSNEIYLKNIKYVVIEKDRYERSITMIYYDNNKYLSAEIIKAGMGWHYKKYSSSKELALLEENAKKKKVGLWIDNNPIQPTEWRNK